MTTNEDLHHQLGSMQANIKNVLDNQERFFVAHAELDKKITTNHQVVEEKITKVKGDLSKLETKVGWFAGAATVLMGTVTFLGDKIRGIL